MYLTHHNPPYGLSAKVRQCKNTEKILLYKINLCIVKKNIYLCVQDRVGLE